MDCANPLRSFLSNDARFSLIQDGVRISASEIAARADDLTARLLRLGPVRIALATQRLDSMYAGLCACQAARKQLLLLREPCPVDHPFWATSGVDWLLDDDLRESPIASTQSSPGPPGVLLMTSGTSGPPKLVLHDWERLLGRIRLRPATPRVARWLLTYHPASFAGVQVALTALLSHDELIAARPQTLPRLADAALQHRPTHISGTPTFWRSFLLALDSRSAQLPLEQITLGGEPVDQRILDQLRAAFPAARLSQIYASTEAGALFAVNDGQAGFPSTWLRDGIDGVQLRITDGVLEVLSPRAMRASSAAGLEQLRPDHGWIVTGDLVEAVNDRVLFRGRLDDVINVGGAKVAPALVESALLNLSCVREARVYGVPNPITGALVAADIVLAEEGPEDAAREKIRVQLAGSLEPYQAPRIMRFVPAIPVNAVGKKSRTP